MTSEPIAFVASSAGYNFGCQRHIFVWNFGDGEIASGENVTHIYAQPGSYIATLMISNVQQIAQVSATITVKASRRRAARR